MHGDINERKENRNVRPLSQHGRWDAPVSSCQKLIKSIQHRQHAGCNTLLVGSPHGEAHSRMTVIKKPGMADAIVIK